MIVVEEAIPILRGIFLQRGDCGAVDEVDVEVAVAVVVEEGDSGNERLDLVFIGSGTVGGYEMQTAFRGNFFESNRAGGGGCRRAGTFGRIG